MSRRSTSIPGLEMAIFWKLNAAKNCKSKLIHQSTPHLSLLHITRTFHCVVVLLETTVTNVSPSTWVQANQACLVSIQQKQVLKHVAGCLTTAY